MTKRSLTILTALAVLMASCTGTGTCRHRQALTAGDRGIQPAGRLHLHAGGWRELLLLWRKLLSRGVSG